MSSGVSGPDGDAVIRMSRVGIEKLEAAGKATEQARNLAFAGIAIVWLFAGPFFKGEAAAEPNRRLYVAGILFAGSLGLDLLQLVARTVVLEVIWQYYDRHSPESEVDPVVNGYPGLNLVTGVLFYAKMVSLIIAYLFILLFFLQKI